MNPHFIVANKTSQQSTETSKEIHQVHSQHPKQGTVELTLGYVFYQADKTQNSFHQPPSGGNQFKETELFAVDHHVNPSRPLYDDQTMNAQVVRNQFNKQSMIGTNMSSVPTSSCLKQPNDDSNFPDYIRNDPSIPDYLPNNSEDQIEMDYVPNEAKDDFETDYFQNGAMEDSVSDNVSYRPVDQIDQNHVPNDFEDKLVMGYVPNGTVEQCGPVEQLVNDIDSDRTVNQPYRNHVPNKGMDEITMGKIKYPSRKIDQSRSHQVPNDSVASSNVNSVLIKPMDLSILGYVKNGTTETGVGSEKLEHFSSCAKDMSITSLFDSDGRKCNPEFGTESDTSSGSSASKSYIHNSGYVTADMINSAGFVSTKAVEQESSGDEEEREEVVYNSGYVSVEEVLAI